MQELIEEYEKWQKRFMPDEPETYTNGYKYGQANGRAQLIAYLLQLPSGLVTESEKAEVSQ
jgi:hypothetical protein